MTEKERQQEEEFQWNLGYNKGTKEAYLLLLKCKNLREAKAKLNKLRQEPYNK